MDIKENLLKKIETITKAECVLLHKCLDMPEQERDAYYDRCKSGGDAWEIWPEGKELNRIELQQRKEAAHD